MDSAWYVEREGVFAEYLAAWRGLKDNPLLKLWQTPRVVRAAKTTRSITLGCLGLVVVLGVLPDLALLLFPPSYMSHYPYMALNQVFFGFTTLAGLPVTIWFAYVLFQSLTDTMSTLSGGTRNLRLGQVDELVGLTSITPVEVATAVVWHNLARLAWPILAALVVCDCSWMGAVTDAAQSEAQNAAAGFGASTTSVSAAALTFLPALAAQLLCSLLAACSLLLIFLALGRGLSSRQINSAVVMQLLGHFTWLLLFFVFSMCISSGDAAAMAFWEDLWSWIYLPVHVFIAAGTLGGSALLVMLLVQSAAKDQSMRSSIAVGLPVILGATWCVLIGLAAWLAMQDESNTKPLEVALSYMLACGMFQTFNPLVTPFATLLGIPWDKAAYYPLFEWYRFPLTAGVLVLMNLAAMSVARHAVILRFRGEP